MRSVFAIICLISVVPVVVVGNIAWATEFKDGASHNIDYSVIDRYVEVDY
jgi:hypothetical protein